MAPNVRAGYEPEAGPASFTSLQQIPSGEGCAEAPRSGRRSRNPPCYAMTGRRKLAAPMSQTSFCAPILGKGQLCQFAVGEAICYNSMQMAGFRVDVAQRCIHCIGVSNFKPLSSCFELMSLVDNQDPD